MFLDIHLVVILKIFKMIAKMISFFFSIDESKLRYLSNMVQVIFYQENIHPISYWKSRKNVNNHCLSEKKTINYWKHAKNIKNFLASLATMAWHAFHNRVALLFQQRNLICISSKIQTSP